MSHVPFLQELYAKFAAGDVPAVLGALAPDIEWRPAEGSPLQPSGEPWRGPQAVLENVFLRLGGEWEGFHAEPQRYHDAGDSVVVQGRYTGTCLATGRALDAQFCHVWTVRDGRLASFHQYMDTAQFQQVMGS